MEETQEGKDSHSNKSNNNNNKDLLSVNYMSNTGISVLHILQPI